MARVLMKGCEAIAEAAVRAGCRFFAGSYHTAERDPGVFCKKTSGSRR